MDAVSLNIDIGVAEVVAVVRWPNGLSMPLTVDGTDHLPTTVHASGDGLILTGSHALQKASTDPDGLVQQPLNLLGGPPVTVAGRLVDPVDLVVALVVRCVAETQAATGRPPTQLCVAVPAGWGPRRQHLLRQAATRAGYSNPHLVPAPVAAAVFATLTAGVAVPVGGVLVVCDPGEVTACSVLRRQTDTAWETLSTITHPTNPIPTSAEDSGPEAQPDVAGAVTRAIEAADIDPAGITAVVCVGPHADRTSIATVGDLRVVVPGRAHQAVALGLAQATPHTVAARRWAPIPAPDPSLHQVAAVAVASICSLLLLVQAVTTGYLHHVDIYIDYIQFNTGELATACVLAMTAAITAGRLLVLIRAAALAEHPTTPGRDLSSPTWGIAAAAGVGTAAAVVYALLASVDLHQPTLTYTGVCLLAAAPLLGLCAWVTLTVPRLAYLGGAALHQLRYPVTAVVLATAGTLAIQDATVAVHTPGVQVLLMRGGGALVGVACLWPLASQLRTRLVVVPLAVMVGGLGAAVDTATTYGYLYLASVYLWWLAQTVAITLDAFPTLIHRLRQRTHRSVDPDPTAQAPSVEAQTPEHAG